MQLTCSFWVCLGSPIHPLKWVESYYNCQLAIYLFSTCVTRMLRREVAYLIDSLNCPIKGKRYPGAHTSAPRGWMFLREWKAVCLTAKSLRAYVDCVFLNPRTPAFWVGNLPAFLLHFSEASPLFVLKVPWHASRCGVISVTSRFGNRPLMTSQAGVST